MSVTLAGAALELLEMRAYNGSDRIAAAIGSIAQQVEERLPFGREIVGAAGACLLVPQSIASLIERTAEQIY